MMKLASIGFFFVLSILCASVFAGELREIELVDGSVISGQVVSFANGVYTLKSSSLGTIKINESKIRAIRFKSHGTAMGKSGGASISAEVQALQKSMMTDKDIMNIIHSLQNDPEFQQILKDPVIMKAVDSGDVGTLISNPKFMKLLGNPRIQEIQKKVAK